MRTLPHLRPTLPLLLLLHLLFCSPSAAAPRFVRGELDGAPRLSLGDAVALLNFLHRGAPAALCVDAADVDDDGAVSSADAARLLQHLFHGGTPPAPPFPDCGHDPTGDILPCEPEPPCRDAGGRAQTPLDLSPNAEPASAGIAELTGDAGGPASAARLLSRESRALPALKNPAGAGGSILVPGRVVDGEIRSRAQRDVYVIEAEPGSHIVVDRIAAASPAAFNWVLEDELGRILAQNLSSLDDLGPVPVLGGRYTLAIFPEGSTVGAYTFRVVDATPVETAVAIGNGSVTGAIEPEQTGKRHHFDFAALPGETIYLEHVPASSSPLNWQLADAHGRLLISPRRIADFGPVSLVGGDYRLTVESMLSGGNLSTGSFEIKILAVPAPAPRSVALGGVASGSIAVPGAIDHWTFTAAPGQLVYLDQISATNAAVLNWELTDAVGRAVISRTTSLGDTGPLALAGGDYLLKVLSEGSGVGSYSFRLADASRSTTAVTLGVEVAGEIPAAQPGRVNVHELVVPAARLLTVELVSASNSAGLNWQLEDALGRRVLARTSSLATVGPVALLGGAYRLSVLGEGAATGTYRFRLRDDGAASTVPPGAPRAVGDSVDDALAIAGGEARYTFDAAPGERIYLDLLLGHADLDWSLLDALGTTVASARANSTDTSDLGPFPLAAGGYTIVVKARTPAAAPPFRFQIARAPLSAGDVSLGATVAGAFLGAPGAVHTYRLEAGDGERVFLDRLVASTRLAWSLLDPAGHAVFGPVRADGADDDAGPFTLAAGVYTLVLDPEYGYQPAYEISVRQVSDDEETAAAGDGVAGNFAGRAGSTRSVRIAVEDGERLLFDRRSATPRIDWSLLDPAGVPVFGPTRFDSGAGDQSPFTLAAGVYTLLLDPQDGYEPSYDIQIVEVADTTAPLVFGQPVLGTLGAGGTASHSFTAAAGARLFLDLTSGASTLRWSLLDELDQAVFEDVAASSAAADVAPFNLAAGSYRLVLSATGANTPSYAFTASLLAVDLGVEELTAAPRVVFAGDSRREIEVSFSVANRGGGPAPGGTSLDRLVYSADSLLGNADDVALGEFVRSGPLFPASSYSRREVVRIPRDAPLGAHRVFLVVDAGGAYVETGAKADNTASLEVEVAADLPAAEPDFIATTTFPFELEANLPGAAFDVPLVRAVTLDSIRHVHADAVSLGLSGPPQVGGELNLTLALLSGREEVLEISTVTASGSGSFVARFSRRLTPQVVALLPQRSIDGVRFRFDQPSTTASTLTSIHADRRLRLTFAGCEFEPCGPHLERRSPGLEGDSLQGSGVSPWRAVDFGEAVPGDGLRFVSGPNFTGGISSFLGVAAATTEAQLILEDGSLVTLDDVRVPSTLGVPPFNTLSAHHSLSLRASQLAGRQVVGFQWRIHLTGAGLGQPSAGFTPLEGGAVRFLYEVDACRGSIEVPPSELSPAPGTVLAPGSQVILSGRALSPQPGREVSAVLVNGEPADAIDAAGRFFKSARIEAGENLFAVEVVEPGCGSSQALLKLVGATDGVSGLEGFAEATAELAVEYEGTTFLRVAESMVVRARARNVSGRSLRGPILMALTGLSPASATLRGAAGMTARGEPFQVLLESGGLAPGAAGPFVYLVFAHPELRPVRYGVRWLLPADQPPTFTSAPPVRAVVGAAYRYAAQAVDLDGDPIAFELERAPAGMAIDGAGTLSWTPGATDLGTHEVSLAAVSQGSRATQAWTLSVTESASNRPPYFVTAPATGVAVGSIYVYEAAAEDPDGDVLVYTLLAGPAGMAIASSGRVTWPSAAPGEHTVSVRAADAAGGESVQTYSLAAGSTPSNPSAPRITTSPVTEARAGILYVYQPVASDPDGDALQFELVEAPAGMSVEPVRGRISWTPRLDQMGSHSIALVVRDGRGGETRQRFEVLVHAGDLNLAPVIASAPSGFALAGVQYRYQVEAIDPEGESPSFALTSRPSGMAIHAAGGLLTWTPAPGDAGTHVVSIEARDPSGAAGRQAFELRVRASNAPPRLAAMPRPVELTAGQTYQVDLEAQDPDGDLLRHELVSGPPAATVHAVTGLVTWETTPADTGEHSLAVRIADAYGGSVEAVLAVTVLPDEAAPEVAIGFSASPAAVGASIEVTVSATDVGGIVARALTVECLPDAPRELELSTTGTTSFGSARAGHCVFRATATDASGNVGTALAALQVGNPDDPLDPHPPVVEVISPAPGATIRSPVDVVATLTDATATGAPGSGPFTWTVELAPKASVASGSGGARGDGAGGLDGSASFQVIGSGAGLPRAQSLGVLDPTMLPNGVYRLRITGVDGAQSGGVEYDVNVAGDLKLGNFTTSVVDLVLPLAGIPVVIARRYDSLDVAQGEFGAGWRLDLPGNIEDSAVEFDLSSGLADLLGREPLSFGSRVYVTRPDGRRVGFTFQPRSRGGALAFLWVPLFEPDPGVKDRLEALPAGADVFMVGGKASQVGVPYNPSVYRLTVDEGVSYVLDEKLGLQQIEDRSGNTIEVRPDGLFSSLGPAIRFERDAAGRIARVIEDLDDGPSSELIYDYDARGNLVASTDALGNSTKYFYEHPAYPHHLTRIVDPLGRPWLRNAYDAAGRLVALCGAEGDPATLAGCSSIDWEPQARVSSVIDARGSRYDLVFDEQGNTIVARQYTDGGRASDIHMAYDARGNLVRLEHPNGEVWTSTHDDRDNETSRTDPLGRTWRWSYDACDELIEEADPAGNATHLAIDEECLPGEWTDALGNVHRFEFSAPGSIETVEDPAGNVWTFGYDTDGGAGGGEGQGVIHTFGYLIRGTDPRGKMTALEANEHGKVTSRAHAGGRSLSFLHDAGQRLIRETWNTDPPRAITFEYDVAGQLVRASDPDSDLRIEYFPTGWVRSMETTVLPAGPSVTIEYEYDGNGNVTAVRDSLGGVTAYVYDAVGRLVSIRQSGAGVNEKRVDAVYSATSALTEIRRFADLAGSAAVASTSFSFECESCPQGVTGVTHRRSASGSLLEHIEIERNAAGLLLGLVDAEGAHTYVHDGGWRLLAADHPAGGTQSDESYAYDGAGNRTSSHFAGAHTYGYTLGAGGNDIRSNDLFEYETDDLGNVARKRDRATGASTEYRYDHRSRLTEVIELTAAGAELRRSTYTYDTSDRRIRSIENGQVFHHVYDGLNPILVLDGAGNVIIRRLYGRGLDSILAGEAGGETRWLLGDHLGSVRDVIGDDGLRIARLLYDSFGGIAGGGDAAAAGGLGFNGLEHSASTGLIHMRARAYDPQIGRYLQMDALEPHQYDYAENSPMTYQDATGTKIRPINLAKIRISEVGLEKYLSNLKEGFYSKKEVLKRLNPPTKYSDYGPKPRPYPKARTSPARGGPGEAGMYALLVTGIGLGIIVSVEQVGTALLLAYDSVLIYQELFAPVHGGQ